MTAPRVTQRRTSLEKHQAEVIALLLTGSTAPAIAEKYKVRRESVHRFMRRHSDKLAALQQVVVKQVEDYAIAQKVNRIATNDMLKNLLLQVRDDRAAGGTGIETGLVVRREKALGSGRDMTIVEEYEIDPALITLIDKLHNSTADELGDKPRPDTNVHQNLVLIREYHVHGSGDNIALG